MTAVLMLDLSKAFDSINHQKLLMRLCRLSVSRTALAWFDSYLTDRKQQVRINSSHSSTLGLKQGVPQGSILGPLLFNLYINDLPLVCKTCKVESYVDDSKLYVSFSNKEINGGLDDLKQDLLRVAAWCCENCLTLRRPSSVCLELANCSARRPSHLLHSWERSYLSLTQLKILVL